MIIHVDAVFFGVLKCRELQFLCVFYTILLQLPRKNNNNINYNKIIIKECKVTKKLSNSYETYIMLVYLILDYIYICIFVLKTDHVFNVGRESLNRRK